MTHSPGDHAPEPPQQPLKPDPLPLAALHSNELLQGRQEVLIEHAGEIYRLRVTRNGKLILHK